MELADFKEFKEQLKLQGVFINREPEHKGKVQRQYAKYTMFL